MEETPYEEEAVELQKSAVVKSFQEEPQGPGLSQT